MICTCECGGAYAMLPVTADGSHGGLNRKPSVQTQTKQRACELEVSPPKAPPPKTLPPVGDQAFKQLSLGDTLIQTTADGLVWLALVGKHSSESNVHSDIVQSKSIQI